MSDNTNQHMSFLDVMACGLGSLLFLCFIFLGTKNSLTFNDENLKGNISPLVILLHSASDEECFYEEENIWIVPSDYLCEYDSNRFLSVLYSPYPPKDNDMIFVKNLKPEVPINIQVFLGGEDKMRCSSVNL